MIIKKKIETRIFQGFPVLIIFFLIYICGVFNKILEINLWVNFLSFIDDLRFIASGNSVKTVVKIFKNIAKAVLEWERQNVVTYNIFKMEAMLFSKSHHQQLTKQLQEAKIKVGNKKILFNKKTTQWLGVWLNSQLKFTFYINKRLKKV